VCERAADGERRGGKEGDVRDASPVAFVV